MTLTDPTDDQLNAAFAEHVAGWTLNDYPADFVLPNFTQSADAVLPWLEKLGFWTSMFHIGEATVSDDHIDCSSDNASTAATFSKAAVLMLLRAHGVEVTFSR